jgi:hypothetical protein
MGYGALRFALVLLIAACARAGPILLRRIEKSSDGEPRWSSDFAWLSTEGAQGTHALSVAFTAALSDAGSSWQVSTASLEGREDRLTDAQLSRLGDTVAEVLLPVLFEALFDAVDAREGRFLNNTSEPSKPGEHPSEHPPRCCMVLPLLAASVLPLMAGFWAGRYTARPDVPRAKAPTAPMYEPPMHVP